MRQIRVAIIDDEPINRLLIRNLIDLHPSLTIVVEADNAMDGAEQIRRERPDAVFLDIHMPRQDGLSMLRSLDFAPKVVFTTCLPQHALEAIELDAVDYLLKPIGQKRFAVAVQRLERLFLGDTSSKSAPIALRDSGTTRFLDPESLIVLHAEGYLTKIIGENSLSLLVGKPIGEFEKLLPPETFGRVDRSTIVNLDRIVRIDHGKRRLWLRGLEQPLELGRAGTERLKELLQGGEPAAP